jgi:hypothetical protein
VQQDIAANLSISQAGPRCKSTALFQGDISSGDLMKFRVKTNIRMGKTDIFKGEEILQASSEYKVRRIQSQTNRAVLQR